MNLTLRSDCGTTSNKSGRTNFYHAPPRARVKGGDRNSKSDFPLPKYFHLHIFDFSPAGKPLLKDERDYVRVIRLSQDALRIGKTSVQMIRASPKFDGKHWVAPLSYYAVNSDSNVKEDVSRHLILLSNLMRHKISEDILGDAVHIHSIVPTGLRYGKS